jgi:hypothetical protein
LEFKNELKNETAQKQERMQHAKIEKEKKNVQK